MAVYEILEDVMEKKGITVADIARICNLPDSTVRGIIRRKQETIALEVAFKISDGLNISLERLNGMPEKETPFSKKVKTAPSYSDEAMKLAKDYDELDTHGKRIVRLVADEEKARYLEEINDTIHKARQQMEAGEMPEAETVCFMVPWFFQPMGAGPGEEAATEPPEDLRLIKAPPRGTSFVASVHGISMEPTYNDDDLVFVHAAEEIPIGRIGVFFMDGQQWIKELGDGVLISHNPDYAPIPMRDDIRCQGLVLGVCDNSYFE